VFVFVRVCVCVGGCVVQEVIRSAIVPVWCSGVTLAIVTVRLVRYLCIVVCVCVCMWVMMLLKVLYQVSWSCT